MVLAEDVHREASEEEVLEALEAVSAEEAVVVDRSRVGFLELFSVNFENI